MMHLTRTQRILLVVGAAFVGVFLIYEADQYGIDDTPWLLGVLIIVGLLTIAASPKRANKIRSATKKKKKSIDIRDAVAVFIEISQGYFDIFNERTPNMKKANEIVGIDINWADFFKGAATKFGYMTTLIVLEKNYPNFRNSPEMQEFRLNAVAQLSPSVQKMTKGLKA